MNKTAHLESAYLTILRKSLATLEEELPKIHDRHGIQIMADHILLMKQSIRRIEEWERKQAMIRMQSGKSELKCGED